MFRASNNSKVQPWKANWPPTSAKKEGERYGKAQGEVLYIDGEVETDHSYPPPLLNGRLSNQEPMTAVENAENAPKDEIPQTHSAEENVVITQDKTNPENAEILPDEQKQQVDSTEENDATTQDKN